jgi:hypothetical protein
LVSRELPELIAIAAAETQEDEIDLRCLLGRAFAPGGAGTLEEATVDAVDVDAEKEAPFTLIRSAICLA